METLSYLLQDAFFAAVAAVGFASIGRPPRRAYAVCAIAGAAGHAARSFLMSVLPASMHIVPACTLAAAVAGTVVCAVSPRLRCPVERCLYPSLLPMVPGMYAYRSMGALALCLCHPDQASFLHYFYLWAYNGAICLFAIMGMATGVHVAAFLWEKTSLRLAPAEPRGKFGLHLPPVGRWSRHSIVRQ